MADKSDFKTAAAKLLAQHSAKKKESPAPEVTSSKQKQSATVNAAEPQQRYVSSAGSELSSIIKGTAIPVLAALGGTIMVFLVPETIFGIWFNGLFGGAAGAFFGYIIIREL